MYFPLFCLFRWFICDSQFRKNQTFTREGDKLMKKFNLFVLLSSLVFSSVLFAAGPAQELAPVSIDPLHRTKSLQNGAKLFVNYCLGCHSAKYVRYERIAQDLEL